MEKLHPNSKWTDTTYVKVYELVLSGLSEEKTARAIGVNLHTFQAWKKARPALQDAVERARQARRDKDKEANIVSSVYQTLPPELKALYERITLCDEAENGLDRMESLLVDAGREARQRLFLFSLIKNNFDVTQACRRVNISKATLSRWVREDIVFADMLKEIDWYKGNFYENALVRLVGEGDTNAVIFANKTYNAGRGYSDKQDSSEVRHTHLHAHFTIDDLDLPLATRMEILQAIRRKKEGQKEIEGKKVEFPQVEGVSDDQSEKVPSPGGPVGQPVQRHVPPVRDQ